MPTRLKISYDLDILSEPINNSKEACDFFRSIWDTSMINLQEQVYLLFFNNRNQVIGWFPLNCGTDTRCDVFVKMAVGAALICMASSVIVAHNHPSEELTPSKSDLFITNKLFRALELLDIKLNDHLILSRSGYFSFIDNDIVIE